MKKLIGLGVSLLALVALPGACGLMAMMQQVPPLTGPVSIRLPGISNIFSALAESAMPDPNRRNTFVTASSHYCPGLSPTIPAAIEYVETRHGQNVAVSSAGAIGDMQFEPATWAGWKYAIDDSGRVDPNLDITNLNVIKAGGGIGLDGDGDGKADPLNPADAIPAAVLKLCQDGARENLHDAIYAYNHSEAYVQAIIAVATSYSQPEVQPPAQSAAGGKAVAADNIAAANSVLRSTRVELTAEQRSDIVSQRIDRRIIDVLNVLSQSHSLAISALRSDHSRYVADANGQPTAVESNHYAGRAVDIYQIDGQDVGPGSKIARQLVLEVTALTGGVRPSEVGSPFYDIFCADIRCFSNDAHQNHVHIGFD